MIFVEDARALKGAARQQWSAKLASKMNRIEALLLWLCFILLGAATGTTINGINVWISKTYLLVPFAQVDMQGSATRIGIWSAQAGNVMADWPLRFVWHGAWHGAVAGAVFGTLLLIYALLYSKIACPTPLIISVIPRALLACYLTWIFVGIDTVILFWIFPQLRIFSYARVVRDVAPTVGPIFNEYNRYVWVVGSPVGAYLGCIVAFLVSCWFFSKSWEKKTARATGVQQQVEA